MGITREPFVTKIECDYCGKLYRAATKEEDVIEHAGRCGIYTHVIAVRSTEGALCEKVYVACSEKQCQARFAQQVLDVLREGQA